MRMKVEIGLMLCYKPWIGKIWNHLGETNDSVACHGGSDGLSAFWDVPDELGDCVTLVMSTNPPPIEDEINPHTNYAYEFDSGRSGNVYLALSDGTHCQIYPYSAIYRIAKMLKRGYVWVELNDRGEE